MALNKFKNKFPKERVDSTLQEAARRFQYPINQFDDLVRHIGREEIEVGNERVKMSCIRRTFTQDFFPIRDQQDLKNKTQRLYDRLTVEPQIKGRDGSPPFPEKLQRIRPRPREPGAVLEEAS
jgi:hypothetical protein